LLLLFEQKNAERFFDKSVSQPFQQNSGGLNSILIPGENDLILTEGKTPKFDSEAPDIYAWLNNNPGGPSQWDTVIERSEVEQHLLKFNHASFRAASTSRCGHGVIMDALTFSLLILAGRSFLRGILPPEWYGDNQLLMKEFLSSFFFLSHHVRTLEETSTKMTEDDVKSGFGKWK
jgi:hypothetical protein